MPTPRRSSGRYGIDPGGNAPIDPQQEFVGKNLLYIARGVDDLVAQSGKPESEVIDLIGRARLILFRARVARPRPHLDDKILTAWNGLMIAAFARMARLLRSFGAEGRETGEPYLAAARRAAAFIQDRWDGESRDAAAARDRDASIDAYAEDYRTDIRRARVVQAGGDVAGLGAGAAAAPGRAVLGRGQRRVVQ
jgi:uncharacterized protein YyaL (SSP411 family)